MVEEDLIARAARALAAAAETPAKVILFGSRARADPADDSDVDFLVVERELADRFQESVRLGRVAAKLRVPADVVVVSQEQIEEWGHLPGTMLHDALTEGRLLAEA